MSDQDKIARLLDEAASETIRLEYRLTPARSNLYRPPPDTPRCNDAAANEESWVRLAQQLERELAATANERDEWRDKAEAYRIAASRREDEMRHQSERAVSWMECAESLANHILAEYDDEKEALDRFNALKDAEDRIKP